MAHKADTTVEAIIKDLAAHFKKHGRILSRREYKRIKPRPYSVNTIERHIGWGAAKHQAAMMLASTKNRGMKKIANPRRSRVFIAPRDEDRVAIMAGMKKVGLPPRYREMLANLVMETERCFLQLPKHELPKAPPSDKEAAILLLSDYHSGKSVFDDQGNYVYNQDIMAFRSGLVKERVCRIIDERLALKRLDEFVIVLIGDIVDGSGIYPGQELNQDLTCYIPQISLAVACIWDIATEIRARGLPVHIKGVRGNHGRQYKYANAANSFDYIVLQMLYMLAYAYDPEGVSVEYANSPFMNFEVKGFRCHMRHEAPVQTETPAARAKFVGWRSMHDFDLMFYGHKHHPGGGTVLDCDAWMNGSLIGVDDLSESMGVYSRPSQTLIGVNPQDGRSFSYNLYADRFAKGGEAKRLLARYPSLQTPIVR